MPITTTVANQVVNHLVGRTGSLNFAGTVYLALSTSTPTAAGGNVTEPSGNGYTRKLLGNYNQSYTQLMGAAASGQSENSEEIHFNKATGSWGTITHVCLYSAATGGTLLAYGALTESKAVTEGDVMVIDAGDLAVLLS